MLGGLEQLFCEDRLRELGMFGLEEHQGSLRRDLPATAVFLMVQNEQTVWPCSHQRSLTMHQDMC